MKMVFSRIAIAQVLVGRVFEPSGHTSFAQITEHLLPGGVNIRWDLVNPYLVTEIKKQIPEASTLSEYVEEDWRDWLKDDLPKLPENVELEGPLSEQYRQVILGEIQEKIEILTKWTFKQEPARPPRVRRDRYDLYCPTCRRGWKEARKEFLVSRECFSCAHDGLDPIEWDFKHRNHKQEIELLRADIIGVRVTHPLQTNRIVPYDETQGRGLSVFEPRRDLVHDVSNTSKMLYQKKGISRLFDSDSRSYRKTRRK